MRRILVLFQDPFATSIILTNQRAAACAIASAGQEDSAVPWAQAVALVGHLTSPAGLLLHRREQWFML